MRHCLLFARVSPQEAPMVMSATFIVSALVQFALQLVVAWLLGPAEFGRYALALAAAVLAQTLLFEWLRLAAIRFHHRDATDGAARRILSIFARIAVLALVLAALALLLPGPLRGLVALVPLVALANAYAELRAALMRAEFDEAGYVRIVLMRNLVALASMPLGVWIMASAEGGLAGFLIAVLAAIIDDKRRDWLGKRNAPPRASPSPDMPEATPTPTIRALIGYSGPIIVTNALYLAIFFGLRGAIAAFGGISAAGQFSLAFDLVAKLFTTIGTALDLLLFQLAVRAEREAGTAAGEARLRTNLMQILALVAPMAIGTALILPSIEALLVAPAFRGAFLLHALMLIPGLAIYTLVQYALHPFFQLRQMTRHLPIAAALGLGSAAASFALGVLVGLNLASASGLALQLGMALAALALLARIGPMALPGLGDLGRLALALGALGVAVLPALMLPPGLASLLAAIGSGGGAYLLTAWIVDLAGIRTFVRERRTGRL